MSEINYKVKYEQLKLKFMSSMDMAYRLGFEDGAKDAQMTQMAEQQQAQEQAAQAQANGFGGGGDEGEESDGDGMGDAPGGAPGQPGEEGEGEETGDPAEIGGAGQPGMEGEGTHADQGLDSSEQDPDAPPVEGSELDTHIAQLEQMTMGKSEVDVELLKKSLAGIKAFKQARDLHKSMKAIKEIGKSLKKVKKVAKLPKKVFSVGKQANANLTNKDKAALGVQEKIVSDIMKSWEEQEKKASKKISEIISVEGLVKKE